MADQDKGLAAILRRHGARLLADWMSELAKSGRTGAIDKAERHRPIDAPWLRIERRAIASPSSRLGSSCS